MSYFDRNVNPNRYVCSVLDEMRDQLKLLDKNNIDIYRSITSLMIEEVQSLANRMEAALEDAGDVEQLIQKRSILKKDIRKLRIEKSKLTEEDDE